MRTAKCTLDVIDSLPGAGKTSWAVRKMTQYAITYTVSEKLKYELENLSFLSSTNSIDSSTAKRRANAIRKKLALLQQEKYPQLIAYVAPTIKLLNQIISSLKSSIRRKLSFYNTKYGVDLSIKDFETKLHLYDTDFIKKHFTESSFVNIKTFLSKAGRQYNYYCKQTKTELQKLRTNDKFLERFSYVEDASYRHSAGVSNRLAYFAGDILFLTNTTFWSANHSQDSLSRTFWNRKRTMVIIDEARSCHIAALNIAFSPAAKEILQKFFDIDVRNYRKILVKKLLNPEFRELIRSTLSESEYAKLYKFVSGNESSSFFMKFNSNSCKTCNIVMVQVPYSALYGWQKVVLMCAFFEDSQLHAILKCAHNIEDLDYSFDFRYITDKCISQDRMLELLTRYKSAKITYVFDNNINISKSLYNNAVVYKTTEGAAESEHKKLLTTFRALRHRANTDTFSEDNNFYSVSEEEAKELSNHRSLHNLICSKNKDAQSLAKRLLSNTNVCRCHPVQAAVKCTIDLARQWFNHRNKNVQAYNESISSLDPKLRQAYMLSRFKKNLLINLNKTLGTHKTDVYDKLIDEDLKQYFCPLTIDARGLNSYTFYTVISVLSAYNLLPAISTWFNQYCVEKVVQKDGKEVLVNFYDQYEDFTLSQCIQTLLRCALRDVDNQSEVLIILSTKKLANDVSKKLANIKVYSPQELFGESMPHYSIIYAPVEYDALSEEQKEAKKKQIAKSALEYANSEAGCNKRAASYSKELNLTDLLHKAYIEKEYTKSKLYSLYNNSSRSVKRYQRNLSTPNLHPVYIKQYTEKLNEFTEEKAKYKQQLVELKAKVEKEFKEKISRVVQDDYLSEFPDIDPFIEKVKQYRSNLASYYKKKAQSY